MASSTLPLPCRVCKGGETSLASRSRVPEESSDTGAQSQANRPRHSAKTLSKTEHRAHQARARRLAERDQISGEIRTPENVTARRAARQHTRNAQGTVAATPVSQRTLVPERKFSGRIIVLTIVTLVVISFLVPTVRTYLQQRAEVTALQERIASEEERQAELYTLLQRWDDPEYVRQQARERINLVMPGEKRYHVMGDLEEEDVESALDEAEFQDSAWTDDLWNSVVDSAAE